MDCAACGRANREGAKFCAGCAMPLAAACASCGTELAADSAFCDECGSPVAGAGARPQDSTAPTAVRKTVTVLFCDLVGSTAFGERVDAESTRDVLGRYHAMAQRVIDDHGGTVAKFIGDGVMAIFGVPEVAADDADRAVAAGLDLQRGFASIGSLASRRYRTELGLRVGINTGEVVIADEDADVVGDVVNTAARLEAACATGQVLVGEDTWRLTRATITYETLGEIEAKGKREGVATFRAVDEADRIDESTTPFVGRDDELSRLHVVFDAAVTAREARLATVIGAPGVGKTRLAAEFERVLGDTATLVDLRVERAGGTTFAPVADLLRAVAGVETLVDEDGPADGDLLVDRLRSVVAGLDDAERVVPLLAGFLGFGQTRSTEELFFAVRRLLEALGRERIVVLVVDDIQWAEPLFLDLLENLVEWIRGSPVMIVALARPEIRELRPAFAEVGRRVADSISVEGLDAGATADLAARLVGADSLPRDLLARLPESTEGNPLFVRELMRMLVDDRVIVETDRGWELRIDADAVDVPPTIQSLLSTRIERLPDDERRVVELASVVGPEFPLGAVAAIEGSGEPGALLPVLERLRRKELVDPTGTYWGDEPVFRFHHVLIRDSAYRRLLKGSRADLHLRVASWMEEAAAGVGGEQEVVVGYHLEQAHELRRQLDATGDETVVIGRRSAALLGAAARRALARDDVAAAGSLFVRAVARLEPSAEELPELLMLGCDALLAVGDIGEAAPLLKQLEEHATADERLSAWASSFRAQLLVLTDPDRLEDAEQRSAAAAQRLADLGDSAGEASARLVRAGALARLGHIGDCEAELDLALAAARAADDGRRVATVLGAAPVAAVWGPSSVSRAGGRCLDVIRLLRITTGSPSVEATATRCQAVLEALRGRFDTARTMLAESRQAVEELGHRRGLLETQLYSGIVELMADDPVAAEPHLRDAYAGLGRLGIGADAGQAAAHLSRALLQQGRLDEAADLAVDSESLAGQNPQTAIAAKTARAEILAAQGDLDSALRLAEEAVARAEGTDIVIDHANANLALARVRAAAGDVDGSRAASADAQRLLREKGASLDVGMSVDEVETSPAHSHSSESPTAPTADDGATPEPWNRADAVARQLLSAFASGDRAALDQLLASDSGLSIRTRLQEAYSTKEEVMAALSADPFGHRSAPEFETLAVRGDDLVLARMEQRRDDDADGLDIQWLAVVRTRADGRADLGVMFDLDELEAAVAELDRLYLDREDDVSARYITAFSAWGFRRLDQVDDDGVPTYAAMLEPTYEHRDHRPLGWGFLDHDPYIGRIRSLLSLDATVSLFLQRELAIGRALRFAEIRLEVADGTASSQVDVQLIVNEVGPSGLLSWTDQFSTDQVEEARARFDEASEAVAASGRLWNVASTSAAAVDSWAAAGRWDLARDWLADDFEVLDAGGSMIAGVDEVVDRAAAAGIGLGADHRRVMAISGEQLALIELFDGSRHVPFHRLAVEEVDRDGRLARVTLFPGEALAVAMRQFRERWIDVGGCDHPDVVRAVLEFSFASASSDVDMLRVAVTDDFSFVDHRPLSVGTLDRSRYGELIEFNEEERALPVTSEVVELVDGALLGRSRMWHWTDDGRWEEAGVPGFSVMTVVDGRVSSAHVYPDDALDAARAHLGRTAAGSGPENDEPWNVADANARHLLTLLQARDVDGYRAVLADDVVLDDRRAHVQLRVEGADAFIRTRRERVFPPDSELVAEGETIASRGDDLALRKVGFREAHRTDGPEVEFLAITSWDGDRLTGTTIFDPDALGDALAELDQLWVEREADVVVRLRTRLNAEVLGAFTRGDTLAGMSFMDDRCTWHDHRPLGFGDLDREGIARRFETLGEIEGERLVYAREGIEFGGPVEFGGPSVILAGPGGATQRDDQLFVNLMDPSSGMMIDCHHYALDQRAEAEACFSRLMAGFRADGDLWNAAVCVGGMVNTWERRDETERISTWVAEGATLVSVDDLAGREPAGGIGIGAEHRRVLAVRGEQLALTELRDAFGDEEFHRLAVEEIDSDARLCRVTHFRPDAMGDALRLLGERWIELDRPADGDVLRTLSAWEAALADSDVGELDRLCSDELSLVDHRPLGLGSLGKSGVVDVSALVPERRTRPTCAEFLEWNSAGALRSLKMYGSSIPDDVDGMGPALSVVAVSDGRIRAIEIFPDDRPDEARACFEELTSAPPAPQPTWRELADRLRASYAARGETPPNEQLVDTTSRMWNRWRSVLGTRDPEIVAQYFDPGLTLRDHRGIGWPDVDREGMKERLRSVFELAESFTVTIPRLIGVDGRLSLAEMVTDVVLPSGAEQTDANWMLTESSLDSGLSLRIEQFPLDELDAACARFDERRNELADENELFNVASLVANRAHTWARTLPSHFPIDFSPDFVVEEADRNVVHRGIASFDDPEVARRVGFGAPERRLLVVRGERLALFELRDEDADADAPLDHRFEVVELDADGLLARIRRFGLDRLPEAVRHVNERSLDVDDPPHRDVLRVGMELQSADARGDADWYRENVADDCTFVDHRPLGFGIGDKNWFVEVTESAGELLGVPLTPRITAWNARGIIAPFVRRRPSDGDDGDDGLESMPGQLVLQVTNGLLSALEVFPDDQAAEAVARYEELTAPVGSSADHEPWNDADRWSREALTTGDASAAPGETIRDAQIESVATRGDRLVLLRRTADGREDLLLQEWSPDGQLDRSTRRPADSLMEAVEELDRWYLDQDPGANVALILCNWAALSRNVSHVGVEAAIERYDDGFSMLDHRALGWPVQDLDGLRARFQSIRAFRGSIELHTARLLRAEGSLALVEYVVCQRLQKGSRQSIRSLIVSAPSPDSGLVRTSEQFAPDDLHLAIARFAELAWERRQLSEPSNTASLVANGCHTWTRSRRWHLVEPLFSTDADLSDAANEESGLDPTTAPTSTTGLGCRQRRVLAVRGERLALMAWADDDLGGEPFRRFALVELNGCAEIESVTLFDWSSDGLIAAADRLDERWLEIGDLPDVERLGSDFVRAFRHRDRDRLAALIADDYTSTDRRPLGWGAFDRDEWLALFDLSAERIVTVVGTVFGSNDTGIVVRMSQWSVGEDDVDEALPGLFVATFRDGLVAYGEGQASDDPADALARLDELTAGETPPTLDHEPWNEADRLAREFTSQATARELEAVAPMLADEVVIDDRRPMVGAVLHGRDAALQFVRPVTPDLDYSARIETVACRGQEHVLARTSLHQVDGEATIAGLHLTSWADGQLLRWTLFDPDDVDAAVAELDRLYLDQLAGP